MWNALLQIQPPSDANSLYLNELICGWHTTCDSQHPGSGDALDWDNQWGNNSLFRYSAFLFNSYDTSVTVADWVAQDYSYPMACHKVYVTITTRGSPSGGIVGQQRNIHTYRDPGSPYSKTIVASKNGYHASFDIGDVYLGADSYCPSQEPHSHIHQEFTPNNAVTYDSTNHNYTNPSEELGRNVADHTEPIYLPLWVVEFHS